jgi:hypothetical protein
MWLLLGLGLAMICHFSMCGLSDWFQEFWIALGQGFGLVDPWMIPN